VVPGGITTTQRRGTTATLWPHSITTPILKYPEKTLDIGKFVVAANPSVRLDLGRQPSRGPLRKQTFRKYADPAIWWQLEQWRILVIQIRS
jgi:hypothetical protein